MRKRSVGSLSYRFYGLKFLRNEVWECFPHVWLNLTTTFIKIMLRPLLYIVIGKCIKWSMRSNKRRIKILSGNGIIMNGHWQLGVLRYQRNEQINPLRTSILYEVGFLMVEEFMNAKRYWDAIFFMT